MKDLKLNLDLFNWHKDTRTITAEASTIGRLSWPFYITVFNEKTQQSRVFRYLSTDTNSDGDIEAWHYENLSHSLKLTIWND